MNNPPPVQVERKLNKCLRCGWVWPPRPKFAALVKRDVLVCSRCHSPYWNKPYKRPPAKRGGRPKYKEAKA